MEKEKREIGKRIVLLAVITVLILTQKVSAKESLQMEQKSNLINSVIKPKVASHKITSEIVYKLNGNYYTVNTFGNTSHAKISRNVEFYLKYFFDVELVQGSILKAYIINETRGSYDTVTLHLRQDSGYYHDYKTYFLYIPISELLCNKQGSIRLGYDITLANGNIIEQFDTSSTDGFYVTLLGEYTVSYNANGGVGGPDPQTKYMESSLILSSTRPVQTGYTFKGWSTSSTVTSAMYQPGDRYTLNNDVTLYAVWEINKYSIRYNANGGSAAPLAQTKNYGESLILSSTKPLRTGYTFQGWATSSTAETANYQPGENYTDNRNITLYAVWEQDLCAPIVESPTAKSVKAGTVATFSVRASGGNPNIYTYQWYYAMSQSETGIRISGATASSYTINAGNMSSDLNGRYYYCEVSNGQYTVKSSRAKLTVLENDMESSGDNNTGNNGNSGNSSGGTGGSSGTNPGTGGSHTVSRPVLQVIQAVSYTKEYGSKSFFLQAFTNGNGKLTYQSSNEKVAEVSSYGQVKLKGYGIAIITVRASQTPVYLAASKQITINVIPRKIVLKKVQSPVRRKISLKWKKKCYSEWSRTKSVKIK